MLDVSAHGDPNAGSRRWAGRGLALASVLALVLLGAFASAAQAEPKAEDAILTCKKIIVTYTGFPNQPGNTITQKVRIDGVKNAVTNTFVFTGPEGTSEIIINLTPGTHTLDLFSKWNTNGVKGGRDDFLGKITCTEEEPDFELEKLQKQSTKTVYKKETIKLGHVGEVIDYEIIVKNTGNVPITLEFEDPNCDEGTITGGPGGPLGVGQSTTYFCKHTLTQADLEAGIRCNTAKVTDPPGPPVTKESNTVCVELPNPKSNTGFGCKKIEVFLTGFPNEPNNKVKIKVRVDGKNVLETEFTFSGTTGVFVYELNLPPGHHSLDVFTKWNNFGFKGGRDQPLKNGITCVAEPEFSIEKLQKIDGSQSPFTTEELEGEVGQTVDYEIIVTNTGNVPLTMSNFTDAGCDEGTIEGPSVNPVQPAGPSIPPGKTTYTCKHTLTLIEAGSEYSNTATDTGNPPEGQGSPVTHESNTVVVKVGQII
jgi:hypothetical protein